MNDWQEHLEQYSLTSLDLKELTDYVIAEKRKRHDKLTLAPESYDFIILIASAQ